MSRRVVIVDLSTDMLPLVVARLPASVKFIGSQEHFDRPRSEARFEGEGLPEWCVVPVCGETFAKAGVVIDGSGSVYFFPDLSDVKLAGDQGKLEWLKKQFGLNN